MKPDLIERLRKRAEIRRKAINRKSVQEDKPDRISDLLEEAAEALESLIAQRGAALVSPTHTDLMVSPEAIDAYLAAEVDPRTCDFRVPSNDCDGDARCGNALPCVLHPR